MKVSGMTAAAAATILLYGQVNAGSTLMPRGKSSILLSVLELFGTFFPRNHNTWEIDAYPQMCKVYMETRDGGNCRATVTYADGEKQYNPDGASWNVCYVGGRQYFSDPRIGDFSITFTKKDGSEGEGLTNPVLLLKYIDNWHEIPVTEAAQAKDSAEDCERHNGINCDEDGPYICHYLEYDYIKNRTKKWECGVPTIGKGGGGLDSNGPVNDRGYAPGWCGVHVIQHQKPDPSKDSYSLEAYINDNNENKIGGTDKAGGPSLSLGSKLPYTLEISTGSIDADPVSFAYADQSWDSRDSSRCKVGAYDSGARQMDCGFTC